MITCWLGMCCCCFFLFIFFLCVVLKRNARTALLQLKPSDMQIKHLYESSCFKTCACVFVCVFVSVFVCVCVDQWSSSLSGWALCFWFLLFFSPFQCFPPLLCSKDKFGRFAKFITFHLWNPTPLHPSSTSSSSFFPSRPPSPPPPPTPTPGYLYWSVGPLLCASLLFMFEFATLRIRLGSIHCQRKFSVFFHLLMTKHSNTLYYSSVLCLGKDIFVLIEGC